MAGRQSFWTNSRGGLFCTLLVSATLPGGETVWDDPEAQALGGALLLNKPHPPTPGPCPAIRLTREDFMCRSGRRQGWGRRRRRRGGRLPGQFCPSLRCRVSLKCRSAFAGQLGSMWTPNGVPLTLFLPKTEVKRPKELREAIKTGESGRSFCSQKPGKSKA